MKDKTTIQIKKEIREQLKKLRNHRRDTYDDVLEKLMKEQKRMLQGK